MPDCSFQSLVLDAVDHRPVAAFWAGVLGRTAVEVHEHESVLEPREGLVWIPDVEEDRTAKTRVHLDLWLPQPDPSALVALGATVLAEPGDHGRWWRLADTEGNEFCVFPPPPAHYGVQVDTPTPYELVVDAADPQAIATWWAERTGGTAHHDATRGPWWWIEGAAGLPFRFWVFNPVPEPKTVKNRLHWDVDLTADTPADLVAAGATLLREPADHGPWWVLADPEGNEFCAFPPESHDGEG